MKDLIIERTRNTPEVKFLESGDLTIEGAAYCEDSFKFFQPLLEWCQEYSGVELHFNVKINYMNTSATKYISQIIRTMDANNGITNKEIKWYFEEDDEDMLEVGQIIEEVTYSTDFYFLELATI